MRKMLVCVKIILLSQQQHLLSFFDLYLITLMTKLGFNSC